MNGQIRLARFVIRKAGIECADSLHTLLALINDRYTWVWQGELTRAARCDE
jgi:hypothetical protein